MFYSHSCSQTVGMGCVIPVPKRSKSHSRSTLESVFLLKSSLLDCMRSIGANFGLSGVFYWCFRSRVADPDCECGIKPDSTEHPDYIIGGTEATVSFANICKGRVQ